VISLMQKVRCPGSAPFALYFESHNGSILRALVPCSDPAARRFLRLLALICLKSLLSASSYIGAT
jgi:hypothetical protein